MNNNIPVAKTPAQRGGEALAFALTRVATTMSPLYRTSLRDLKFIHTIDDDGCFEFVYSSANGELRNKTVYELSCDTIKRDLNKMRKRFGIGGHTADVDSVPEEFDVVIQLVHGDMPDFVPSPSPSLSLLVDDDTAVDDEVDGSSDDDEEITDTNESDLAPDEPIFMGFMPEESNFVRCPTQFFTEIVPFAKPTVIAIVAAVIYHTRGWHDPKRHSFGRVWWPTTGYRMAKASGITHRSSVKSIQSAVDAGYIVVEKLGEAEAATLKNEFGLDYIPTINISLRGTKSNP